MGPAGIPADVTEAIGRAAGRVLNEPGVRSRLEATGTLREADSSPAATRAFLDRQFALYRAIVQRIGLRMD